MFFVLFATTTLKENFYITIILQYPYMKNKIKRSAFFDRFN